MNEIVDFLVIEAAAERYSAEPGDPISECEAAIEGSDRAKINGLDDVNRYVNRFIQMGRSDLAATFVQEFTKGTNPSVSALERIIEQNELMGASFFARGATASRTVGRIVVRDGAGRVRGHGTGFMISPRLMMTNNHVLNTPNSAANSLIEFDYALGIDGLPMISSRFDLDPSTFFETSLANDLDYTIVAVKPTNDSGEVVEDRGWMHLIADSGKAVVGEPINIVQHPEGERLQIAIRENKIVKVVSNFLLYTTDTRAGSSGALCANDQWQVAALHHSAVPDKDTAGRWLRRDGGVFRRNIDDPSTIKWIANEGVRISSIVRDMRTRSLSPDEESLFQAVFEPAPMFESSGNGAERSSNRSQPGDDNPSGMTIGPDGVARWNFQLSFGPFGTSQAPPAANRQHTSPPKLTKNTTSEPDTNTIPPAVESVFEPRGPYYDKSADQIAIDKYYSDISTSVTKKELFKVLSALLKKTHHTVFSYPKAKHDHLYKWIDRQSDTSLRSIYSGDIMPEELFVAERMAFEAALSKAASAREMSLADLPEEVVEMEDLALEATSAFNCEHVVPQSWFKGETEQGAQKSDLHHLFTCESGCNSFRSNIPYSEFSPEEEAALLGKEISAVEAILDPTLEAARPQCGLRDGRRFEPSAGKGIVARATLYFLLRYPGVVGDIKSGKKKELTKSNMSILLDWAQAEEPSDYERHRNAEIAKVQGNRNPLIDHPEWISEIAFEEGFG